MKRAVGLLVIVLAGGFLAQPSTALADAGRPAATVRAAGDFSMCQRYQHLDVSNGAGPGYTIYNDIFGSPGQCLVNRRGGTNFDVATSKAASRTVEPVGFPDIFYGCSRGTCSRGSTLPMPIRSLRNPQVSWYTTVDAGGRWNAAFDIWFSTSRQTTGQPNGAELMIWLNERAASLPIHDGGRYFRADGTTWWFDHWRACLHQPGPPTCWNYVRFWRVRRTNHATKLALATLISAAERSGLIRSSWWLENISAGYEIWRGGTGLATTWFSASPVKTSTPHKVAHKIAHKAKPHHDRQRHTGGKRPRRHVRARPRYRRD